MLNYNDSHIDTSTRLNTAMGIFAMALGHFFGFIQFLSEHNWILKLILTALTAGVGATTSFFVSYFLKKLFHKIKPNEPNEQPAKD